jgi:hypothetical protein
MFLVVLGGVLIASGYALYYANDDGLRRFASTLHWLLGLLFALPLAIHGVRSGRYRAPQHGSGRQELHQHDFAAAVDDDAFAGRVRRQQDRFTGRDGRR